uniref:Uncharacterized protein n=1 Tax=Anopheles coluzzii TaxID=1518534 RepID=A0A8W7P090_ANOCL
MMRVTLLQLPRGMLVPWWPRRLISTISTISQQQEQQQEQAATGAANGKMLFETTISPAKMYQYNVPPPMQGPAAVPVPNIRTELPRSIFPGTLLTRYILWLVVQVGYENSQSSFEG